jgi:hypothetical protein
VKWPDTNINTVNRVKLKVEYMSKNKKIQMFCFRKMSALVINPNFNMNLSVDRCLKLTEVVWSRCCIMSSEVLYVKLHTLLALVLEVSCHPDPPSAFTSMDTFPVPINGSQNRSLRNDDETKLSASARNRTPATQSVARYRFGWHVHYDVLRSALQSGGGDPSASAYVDAPRLRGNVLKWSWHPLRWTPLLPSLEGRS